MPKAYSGDLRVRVIEMVQAGASRREAAEEFSVAGSTAVKWLQRWEESGSAEAKPRGGSISPLEVHATVILEVECTYALFIGWVLYGGYLFFNGDWWSINLLMLFIAFSLSFIVYRTLEIITDTR